MIEIKGRALVQTAVAAVPNRQAVTIGFLTGRTYAFGQEEVHRRGQERTEHGFAFGATWLESMVADGELPFPSEIMICIIHALMEGILRLALPCPAGGQRRRFRPAFDFLALKRTNSVPKSDEPAK